MVLDKSDFGLLMLTAGMGLTLITLWVLTLVIRLLKLLFPPR